MSIEDGVDGLLGVGTGEFMFLLALGAAMIVLSVGIHLGFLLAGMRRFERARAQVAYRSQFRRTMLVGAVVLWLFLAIVVQCWCWAVVFRATGAMPTMEEAIYFSTVTFTTLGYGDVVIEGPWRLLGAFESANGTMIIGLTTAVIFIAVQRLFETDLHR